MRCDAFVALIWRQGDQALHTSPVLVQMPDGEHRPVRSVLVRKIDGVDTMVITVKRGGGPRG